MKKERRYKLRVTRSIIPNMFTMMNLFGGFMAIIKTTEGAYLEAATFILLAAVFDALDGAVARLTRSTSEIGVQLDSLCDAVSFGVAPAFMLYMTGFHEWGRQGVLLAALPAFAGVYRLARFNVQVSGFDDKLYFRGMPIPAGAMTIVSYILFFHITDYFTPALQLPMLVVVSAVVALAMVSTVKFDNAPRFSKEGIRKRPWVAAWFIGTTVASIATKGVALFPAMAIYLTAGFLRHIILLVKERSTEEQEQEEIDTLEADEPDPLD